MTFSRKRSVVVSLGSRGSGAWSSGVIVFAFVFAGRVCFR